MNRFEIGGDKKQTPPSVVCSLVRSDNDLDRVVERQISFFANISTEDIRFEKKQFSFFCKINSVPKSYKEMLKSPEAKFWKKAVEDELAAQIKNHTWSYVNKDSISKNSKSIKVIDSRWVFTKKEPVEIDEAGFSRH